MNEIEKNGQIRMESSTFGADESRIANNSLETPPRRFGSKGFLTTLFCIFMAGKLMMLFVRSGRNDSATTAKVKETRSILQSIACLARDGHIPDDLQEVLGRLNSPDNCGCREHRRQIRTLRDGWERRLVVEEIDQLGPPRRSLVRLTSVGRNGRLDVETDEQDDIVTWFLVAGKSDILSPGEDPSVDNERPVEDADSEPIPKWRADIERVLPNLEMRAHVGWIHYLAGEFVGEAARGQFTDPDVADPGYEFWSDGEYALSDEDGDGRFDSVYRVNNRRLDLVKKDRMGRVPSRQKTRYYNQPFSVLVRDVMNGIVRMSDI